jgi:hypothetical protein
LIRSLLRRWLGIDHPAVTVVVRADALNSGSSVKDIANAVRAELIRNQRRNGGSTFL